MRGAPRAFRADALAVVIGCALAGLPGAAALVPGAASAAEPAGDSGGRQYAIGPGRLSDVLAEFAAVSGVQLVFEPGMLAGLRSGGLRGGYSVRDGFARLLAGSGYEAVSEGGGRYALRRAARGSEVASLAPVTVAGSLQSESLARVKADEAAITRSGASILDTPMTVSVVPARTASDQAAQTVGDVVRNVPGVRTDSYVGSYDSLFARGFWASTVSNYLRNGMRYVNLMQPGLHNIERYEVIKGAMSLDYGRVEPGVLLNIVTKKPQAEPLREVTLGIGQRNSHELAFDLAGSLNESETALFRLNGGAMRQAYATEAIDPRQYDVAGALAFKLAPRTQLDLDFEYTRRKHLSYTGVPVPDPRDVSSADSLVENFYGEREGTFKGHHRFFSVRLKHQLNDEWEASLGYANNQVYRDPRNVYFDGISDGMVERYAYTGDQKFDMQTFQAELKGSLMLAGMKHRITLTADSVGYKESGAFPSGSTALPPVSIYDPHFTGGPALLEPYDLSAEGSMRDTGIAIQDLITIDPRWQVLAGLRYSRFSDRPTDWSGAPDVVVPRQSGSHVDPTVGVVFKPQPWASIYGSYTRSSTPNVGVRTAPGEYADPSRAEQLELGVKAEWFDGRLRTSIARFDLTKSNVPTASQINPGFQDIAGEIRVKGWEFEAVGQLTPRWNVIAGYALTDGEITQDNNPANLGKTPANTPRHVANLWTTYDLYGAAQGWTVGVGLFHSGSRYVNNMNEARLPSYTVVDAMAAYTFSSGLPGARLQINLRNVFNKVYYESGSAWGADFNTLYPGLPRTLSATLTVPF